MYFYAIFIFPVLWYQPACHVIFSCQFSWGYWLWQLVILSLFFIILQFWGVLEMDSTECLNWELSLRYFIRHELAWEIPFPRELWHIPNDPKYLYHVQAWIHFKNLVCFCFLTGSGLRRMSLCPSYLCDTQLPEH